MNCGVMSASPVASCLSFSRFSSTCPNASTLLSVLRLKYERSLWFILQTNRVSSVSPLHSASVCLYSFVSHQGTHARTHMEKQLVDLCLDRQQSQSNIGQQVFCCLTRCCLFLRLLTPELHPDQVCGLLLLFTRSSLCRLDCRCWSDNMAQLLTISEVEE